MITLMNATDCSRAGSGLRSFDARRDLQAVADLIELGFAETLDDDGRRYLSQMRAAANSYRNLGWLGIAGSLSSYSMSGYVWEEEGRLIGNLSLIPYLIGARRCYMIANVVVHPDYRRRGIGRALTVKALEHCRNTACPVAWLQVREENGGAIALYQSLGFQERARRTTWQSQGDIPVPGSIEGVKITSRMGLHWAEQRRWLQANYPKELLWNLPLKLNSLRPGLMGGVTRIFSDTSISQWSIQRQGKLCAVAAWQTTQNQQNILWLAAPPDADAGVLQALLAHARQRIPTRRPATLDYPAGQSAAAIQGAGFRSHQTLIWMEIKFG